MSPSVEEPQERPEPTPEEIAAGEAAAARTNARIAAFSAEVAATEDVRPEARIPEGLEPPAVIAVRYPNGWEYWRLLSDGTWQDDADNVTIFRDGTELGWYIGRDEWHLLVPRVPVPRPDEAEHGHTFRISQTSRMSAGLWSDEKHEVVDWQDADWWGPDVRTVEVRAFDLPTALRLAAALPLSAWWPELGEKP